MKIEKIKFYLYTLGYFLMMGYALTFLLIFLDAYFYPGKLTMVDINIYGEANFEFGLILITLPIIGYNVGVNFLKYKNKRFGGKI